MISERMAKMAAGGSAIRAMFEEGKRLAAQYGNPVSNFHQESSCHKNLT